ncbi:MAG: peptidoglycan-binding protein, partial [Chloroflexota bacterium]
MPNAAPNWLASMREIDGTKWGPGEGPNATIQSWLRFIGTTYPNMATYCKSVVNEDYFSWCGLTVGYCMAKSEIAPVFGATDISRFLYAAAWLGWGTPVTTPQPGDVLVFDFGGGDHHVTLFEKDNGNGTWSCHGGNQTHEVKRTNFPKNRLMGIRRPSVTVAAQGIAAGVLAPGAEGRAVTTLQTALASQGFDAGGIDGEFGPLTSAAVSSFQRARDLPVTGVADQETFQALGLSTDVGPQPNVAKEQPTMQVQDLLRALIDALITRQKGAMAAPTPPATSAQSPIDITQVLQTAIAALAGKPPPASAVIVAGTGKATGTTAPTVLSPIDQILG